MKNQNIYSAQEKKKPSVVSNFIFMLRIFMLLRGMLLAPGRGRDSAVDGPPEAHTLHFDRP